MKEFEPVDWDAVGCREELDAFRGLLASSPSLMEREDILPFFRRHRLLAAFLGSYHSRLASNDRLAYEYDLFGDFACDLAVGDSRSKVFGFVEFEEAAGNSIFIKRAGKTTLEWAPRFVQGFCQIVDWFYKLDDMEGTREFENRFGAVNIDYFGLLIIGRTPALTERERRRLHWWEEKIIVNSHRIHCVTFDQLYLDIERRLDKFKVVSPQPGQKKRKK